MGNGQTNDITKASLQALFNKQSKPQGENSSKALPLSDACFTLVKQIDAVKQSTKFILKQLLMNGNAQGRNVAIARRDNSKLKNEITTLKQEQSSQRLQFEQMNNEHVNILNAKENVIRELTDKLQEKDRMVSQFRNMHGKTGSVVPEHGHAHTHGNAHGHQHTRQHQRSSDLDSISQFSQQNRNGTSSHSHAGAGPLLSSNMSARNSSSASAHAEPPLKGLIAKRSAQQVMQQQVFNRRRGPNVSSGASVQSSITGIGGGSRMGGGGGGGGMGPIVTQRFASSAHSTDSNSFNSVTPRVRDLSHNAGFNFSGGSRGSGNGNAADGGGSSSGGGGIGDANGQRLNKRRRAEPTPVGNHHMSPNTAFTLNQGNFSTNRGGQNQRWS